MSCDAVRELLSAQLDGELDDAERRLVERHLAVCAACAAEMEALRRTVGLVKGLPREAAPAGLAERIRDSLPLPEPRVKAASRPAAPQPQSGMKSAAPPRRKIITFRRVALAVAAGALVGIAVRVAFEGSQSPPVPGESAERKVAAAPPAAPDAEKTGAAPALAGRIQSETRAGFKPADRSLSESRRQEAAANAIAPRDGAAPPPLAEQPAVPPSSPKSEGTTPAPAAPTAKPAPVVAKREAQATPAAAAAPAPDAAPAVARAPAAPPPAKGDSRFGTRMADETLALQKNGAPSAAAPKPGGAAQPPAAEQAPAVVLALRTGDVLKQAEQLDQWAYGADARMRADVKESSDKAPVEKARAMDAAPAPDPAARAGASNLAGVRARAVQQAVNRKQPFTLVYDLAPEDAARFLDRLRLASQSGLTVSVEETKFPDAIADASLKDRMQATLDQLAGPSEPAGKPLEVAAAEKKAAVDQLRKAQAGEAEQAKRAEDKDTGATTGGALAMKDRAEESGKAKGGAGAGLAGGTPPPAAAAPAAEAKSPAAAAPPGAPAPPPAVAAGPAPSGRGAAPGAAIGGGAPARKAAEPPAEAEMAKGTTKQVGLKSLDQEGGAAAPRRVRIVIRLMQE